MKEHTHLETISRLKNAFSHQYGENSKKITIVSAPCVLNLLGGDYTEHEDGFSLLATGQHRVYIAAQVRTDRQAMVYSLNYDEKFSSPLGSLKFEKMDGWANYPKGILYFYERMGRKLEGIQLAVLNEIPEQMCLKEMAALNMAVAFTCNVLGTRPLDDATLVKLSQRVETQFLQIHGDYYSPFASRFGKQNHLVIFDPRSFKPDYVPFDHDQVKLVVIDSGVRNKSNVEQEFNKRLEVFQQLLNEVRKHVPKILTLRDLTPDLYETARKRIDILMRKRLDYIVFENHRVQKSKEFLIKGDYLGFGALLNESQDALAEKLKITCPEIDILSQICRKSGCLGARMAGMGWGGTMICLVKTAQIQPFIDQVQRDYKNQVNISPQCYIYDAGDGIQKEE
jgi:galactokinase